MINKGRPVECTQNEWVDNPLYAHGVKWADAKEVPHPFKEGTTTRTDRKSIQRLATYTGVFHTWGMMGEGDCEGMDMDTVGVVELNNGKVKTFSADNIRFLDK